MKTDTIFYQLFQNFPSIFFELIGQPAATGDIYEFISSEVKQTAFRIDISTGGEETSPTLVDGLFLPAPG
ncbi:hypothetical protein CSQ79_23600 [Gloeocapsopsis sp. IPPAS B-1203]|nr:hypothetical protein CSQ79_23600 [Gloeocapsopsis sp. IPPAS B-1203]